MKLRKTLIQRLTPVTAAGVALSLLLAGCGSNESRSRTPTLDELVQVAFLKQYKLLGRPALIEFGAIDCELSGQGLDEMIRLHRNGAIPGLAYFRVELGERTQAAEDYYAGKSPGFGVHYDPDASLAQAARATVYPRFVLVGKFGHVRYRGRLPSEHLADWARLLGAETRDPGPDVPLMGVVKLDAPKLLAATRLPELKGEVKPLADYMGRAAMMVMFVDTICPFSAKAIEDMPKVAAALAKHMVASVLVNLDDPAEEVRGFYAERRVGAPVLYDTTTGTKHRWNLDSVPTVVFIDSAGQIAYSGPAVWADLAKAGEKALGLPPGSISFAAKGTQYG